MAEKSSVSCTMMCAALVAVKRCAASCLERGRGHLGNRVKDQVMQRNGDGRTVAHAIQCHFCDDIVDVAYAQQADGQPSRCVALRRDRGDSGVFEMVCKERSGRIELSGGVLCVLGYGYQ